MLAREMPFGQEQPMIASVFGQPSAGLDQTLLQTRQRPVPNLIRQRQSSPKIPQVIGDHAQPQTHFISSETMARKTGPTDRQLTFLDPFLRRPSLVIEPHDRPAGKLQVGDDEAHTGKQLPGMKLHLGHYPTRRPPTARLVEKTLVAYHRLLARPSYRTREQFFDLLLQILIRGEADGILHPALFQCPVDLWLGKSRVAPKRHLLPVLLLALNLRQEHLFPALSAVYIARS